MEVKINREIRNYTESIFFGLSLRQFLCSICACVMAVLLYFVFSKYFNKEIVSWICVLGALPFAGLGFFKYNGMPLEEFIIVWIESCILKYNNLKCESKNMYYEMITPYIVEKEKEELNRK